MDRADCIARVVLTREQCFRFGRDEFVLEPIEQLAQLIQRTFVFFRKFKEHASI